jgi:SnoaL-like domain
VDTRELSDRFEIRELLENWAIWRDSGQWDRLATTFHSDGWMVATWQTASAEAFIAGCRGAWDRGVKVLHTLSGSSIDLDGFRAVAQTKMAIIQRAQIHDVWVDVTCRGRFYDFLEKRDGRWAILLRQPIYEYDRIDPLAGWGALQLDQARLSQFPEGYRHLGYIQSLTGFDVRKDLPGLRGPEVEAVYARGLSWLRDGVSPLKS